MGQNGARVVEANRSQLEMRTFDLDGLIPQDHRARLMWEMLGRLDLSGFYEHIKARGSEPGRPATDPKVLIGLWLYATAQGVGSARELERLCDEHHAYQWLRGGVPVNHHTLSDFRVDNEQALDDLFTQVLAVLVKEKLVDLRRVAQDGTRVRASAGSASLRRRKRLKDYLKLARKHVEEVKQTAEDAQLTARQKAAQERAAREKLERLERAVAELKKVEEQRSKQSGGRKARSEPRASTTDPEVRNMRMADGGHHPAYNVQLATDTKANAIVGLSVINRGTDHGEAQPMIEQIERRTGQTPKEYLVDGGYTGKKTVEALSDHEVTLYGAVPNRWGQDPYATQITDSAAVAQWRKRMATDNAKVIYRDRASTIERVNADLKTHRSLDRLPVRGLKKVLSITLWNALTYNILRWIALSEVV